jgi:phosphomannomutase/phosphoglucomutase
MITGSHNPPEYNGLKMMIGGVTLAEDLIQALYRRLQDNSLSEGSGTLDQTDLGDQYIAAAMATTELKRPLKVAVDCGNGVAGELGPKLISALGCEVIPLFCEIDGNFPNHHPDPAEPENLQDLVTAVKTHNADVGLAFDGDGDRLGIVTPQGEIIWPDKMMMLFAQDIISRNPNTPVIFDVKCSKHLERIIREAGGEPIMWKTGHSHIKAKIKQTQAAFAGEFSGHICFGERWYGFDDALYTAARLLELLSQTDLDVDTVFAQYPVTYSTPEIKIHTTETRKFEVMDELVANNGFADGRLTTIDGIRVDFDDRWGLIRPSNTSPVLSLRFEADTADALERVQDEFQAQLSKVDSTLTFR